jgi:hypothetical protein
MGNVRLALSLVGVMSSILKERLLDYGMERLSIEEKVDIDMAIEQLLREGKIYKRDRSILLAYIYGYTAQEISDITKIGKDTVVMILACVIIALADILQIKDNEFIEQIKDTVPQSKLPRFEAFLNEHDLQYDTHTVRKG